MEFKWLNESKIMVEGDKIEIMAPAKTDFFCGSIDECEEGILPESLCNAPFYYTLDGVNFYMMRYFHLPVPEIVKVGLLAQAPAGKGGKHIYEHLSIEQRTVKNIRAGK